MKTLLYNAQLVMEDKVIPGYLCTEGDKITDIGFGTAPSDFSGKKIDARGYYLAPGFIELHTHGAGGADFMDGTLEAYEAALKTHLAHGTTTIMPTTVAATKGEIVRSIDAFRNAKEQLSGKVPHMYGIHMEGPYLCREQCGAIDPTYIRDPKPEEYEFFLDYGRGIIKRWTLAVERAGAHEFISRMIEENILPSIGHSNATYAQVLSAYHRGVRFITHLYSSMSTIVRKSGFRIAGVLESAFCIQDMYVEMIADGCHIPVELLAMVYRVKGADHVALTCDSMRCAGQDVTEAIIGSLENGQRAIIEDGVAKLPNRQSFAGSIALDDRLVRTMYHKAGIPLYDAVKMMTLTPAKIIGEDHLKGSLKIGKQADIIAFDEEINIKGVMLAGVGQDGVFV